jgi:hypothetical protein
MFGVTGSVTRKGRVPIVLPTHHCFDDALDYIVVRLRRDKGDADRLRLVHGIVRLPDEQPGAGERVAHAWVEEAALVFDSGLLNGQQIVVTHPKLAFYRRMRVESTTVYRVEEAWALNALHRTFGPWEPQYQALCGKGVR